MPLNQIFDTKELWHFFFFNEWYLIDLLKINKSMSWLMKRAHLVMLANLHPKMQFDKKKKNICKEETKISSSSSRLLNNRFVDWNTKRNVDGKTLYINTIDVYVLKSHTHTQITWVYSRLYDV